MKVAWPAASSPAIWAPLGLASTLFFSGAVAEAQTTPVSAVSVDLPHGGCRLSMSDDGQASITYGSMPRRVRVTPGTFDYQHVSGLLRLKSSPPGERLRDSGSAGTVALPGSEVLRVIDDAGWVRSLLEQAWKARVAPTRESPLEDHRWIATACSFVEKTQP